MAFQLISTILIAIALAMDAFSVSLTKGFTQKQAVLIMYGLSATFGMFAIILMESGIWKRNVPILTISWFPSARWKAT